MQNVIDGLLLGDTMRAYWVFMVDARGEKQRKREFEPDPCWTFPDAPAVFHPWASGERLPALFSFLCYHLPSCCFFLSVFPLTWSCQCSDNVPGSTFLLNPPRVFSFILPLSPALRFSIFNPLVCPQLQPVLGVLCFFLLHSTTGVWS